MSVKRASGEGVSRVPRSFRACLRSSENREKMKRVALQAIPSAVLLVFDRVLSEQTERR